MNLKDILLFIGGIAIGGTVGILGTKKYFQDKYRKYYEEDREVLNKYYRKVETYKDELSDNEKKDEEPKEEVSRPGGRMNPEERELIKKKLQENYEKTTNYAAMYKGKRSEINPVDDPAELERPLDDEEETTTTPEEEAFDEHQKNMDKPTEIISAEEYGSLPAYIEQQALYFYAYDEVLTDEEDQMIDEPEILVGDVLTQSDFIDNDERVIFVMNYSTDTCYEIQKVDASWTDSH